MAEALAKEQVQKLASLARLELTDEEVARYQTDLTAILGYLDTLRAMPELEAGSVQLEDNGAELRPDAVYQFSKTEDLVSAAAGAQGAHVTVPTVFGEKRDE